MRSVMLVTLLHRQRKSYLSSSTTTMITIMGDQPLPGFVRQSYVLPLLFQRIRQRGSPPLWVLAPKTKFCSCCRRESAPILELHPQGLKPEIKMSLATIVGGSSTGKSRMFENHLNATALARKSQPEDSICMNIRRCKQCKKLQFIQSKTSSLTSAVTQVVLAKIMSCWKSTNVTLNRGKGTETIDVLAKPWTRNAKRRNRSSCRGEVRARMDDEFEIVEEDLWSKRKKVKSPEQRRTKRTTHPHIFFDIEARQHQEHMRPIYSSTKTTGRRSPRVMGW